MEIMEKQPRLLAVPDIHGRVDLLNLLLDQVLPLMPNDKIVFLGDYVDRGPDARGVLDRLMELQKDYPGQIICLAGNHDRMMVRGLQQGPAGGRDGAYNLWMVNGAQATMNSFGWDYELAWQYGQWILGLPFHHLEDGYFFTHAPIPHNVTEPYDEETMTWGYWDMGVEGKCEKQHIGRVGVCGHIHRLHERIMTPRFYDHYIYADCGCGCHPKAPLVAIEVRTRTVTYARPL